MSVLFMIYVFLKDASSSEISSKNQRRDKFIGLSLTEFKGSYHNQHG